MRSLYIIAEDIQVNWDKVNYAALPYLQAMKTLNKLDDDYFRENGRDIVTRFLANASTWRGADARRIKLELKEGLKE